MSEQTKILRRQIWADYIGLKKIWDETTDGTDETRVLERLLEHKRGIARVERANAPQRQMFGETK